MTYYLVYPLAYLVGLLPYKAQFLLSDILRGVLYHVVRYRRKVVRENLVKAFPEKSGAEIRKIERNFYKHLADVCIETMSLASVSAGHIQKRLKYLNFDDLHAWTGGRSWICAMAHYGSWEYTINFQMASPQQDAVLAVYRPLHNKDIDRFYRRIRSRFGVVPVPMKEVGREMVQRRKEGQNVALALIADQTPPWHEIQNWTLFFGRWTPFFMGTEKLARRMNMPVVFLDIDKTSRGYYEARFELLYDGEEEVGEGEITRRYAARLEEMMRRRPELWMWSHRRWKHKREDFEAEQLP